MEEASRHFDLGAALGVLEHWRFDGSVLEIQILKNGQYFESIESLAFPGLFFAPKIAEFVAIGKTDITSMNRQFRAWIREELRKQSSTRKKKKH